MNSELSKKSAMNEELIAFLKYLIAGGAAGAGISYAKSKMDPMVQNTAALDVPRTTSSLPVLQRTGPERGMLDKLYAPAQEAESPDKKELPKPPKQASVADMLLNRPVAGVVGGTVGLGLGTMFGDKLLEKRRVSNLNETLAQNKQMLDDLLLLEQYVASSNKLPKSLEAVKSACLTKISAALTLRDLGAQIGNIIDAGSATGAIQGLDAILPAIGLVGVGLGANTGYHLAANSDENRQLREKIKATLAERLQEKGPVPVMLRSPRIGANPIPENLRTVSGLSGGRDAIAGI